MQELFTQYLAQAQVYYVDAQRQFSACPYNLAIAAGLAATTLLFFVLWRRAGACVEPCCDEDKACCSPPPYDPMPAQYHQMPCCPPPPACNAQPCQYNASDMRALHSEHTGLHSQALEQIANMSADFASKVNEIHDRSMSTLKDIVKSLACHDHDHDEEDEE